MSTRLSLDEMFPGLNVEGLAKECVNRGVSFAEMKAALRGQGVYDMNVANLPSNMLALALDDVADILISYHDNSNAKLIREAARRLRGK